MKRKQTVEVDGKFDKNDNFTLRAKDNAWQTTTEEIGGMTKAEIRALLKEWETKMDIQQAQLKELKKRYD